MTINPEGLIPIFGGVFAWLMAAGKLSPTKDMVKWEAWRLKWGPNVKILSLVVIVFGIAQFAGLLMV
jgi:hypothetical protein